MLILSRKLNEALIIADPRTGERIRIVVTAIHRGRVQLGIEAPGDVHVWREELGFDFSLPAGSVISGIQFSVERGRLTP